MNDLPDGWTQAKLPELAELIMGQSPPSSTYNNLKQGLPFFQGKAEFGKLHPTATKYCSMPQKVAKAGDILISVRAPVGPTNLAAEDCCIGRGLAAIRPLNGIPSRFLLYYLRSIKSWLSEQGTGSTFTAISRSDLEQIVIPIPSLNEQRRIVAKLETVLSRVDAAQARLERIPLVLKRFRQSVLAAACSGKLTSDWRIQRNISDIEDVKTINLATQEDLQVPSTWNQTTMDELLQSIQAGNNFACVERPPEKHEAGVLKISAVTWGNYDEHESKTCTDPGRIKSDLFVRSGDFLFTRANTIELVGACVIAQNVRRKIMLSDKVLRFVFKNAEPQWVLHFLRSSYGRSQIEFLATGNQQSMRNIRTGED